MRMENPETAALGESAAEITLESSEQIGALVLAMARQCQRELDIASRQLDPAVYDSTAFVDAVKDLVLGSRYARVRILINLPEVVIKQGHRLVTLAMKLSSFIEIRVPAPEDQDFNQALLIADRTGYIHQQLSDRYEGSADFSNRARAGELARAFDLLWEKAAPDPNLRRLHI